LGKVVVINTEMLGDTGVQENGEWKDMFDLKLAAPDGLPFTNRTLPNLWLAKFNLLKLPEMSSVTINEITTNPQRIQQITAKYNPGIESMEGSALHYICRQTNTPFIQVRAISNYIGERDKTKWKMKEAITNLNSALVEYLEELKVNSEELKVLT
jgi:futalosine hydrolase